MVEELDRLPDWAYTDSELDTMAEDVVNKDDLAMPGHITLYHMYKDGVNTGIVMLLAVDSVSDGLHAINRLWGEHGMYAEVGEFNEKEDYAVMYKLKALELVLNKYKYNGKIVCAGSDKLYRYQKWFDELI